MDEEYGVRSVEGESAGRQTGAVVSRGDADERRKKRSEWQRRWIQSLRENDPDRLKRMRAADQARRREVKAARKAAEAAPADVAAVPVRDTKPRPIGRASSREIDAKVRKMWDSGVDIQREIGRMIGVSPSCVGDSLRRQGLIKKPHPILGVARRTQELADDLTSYVGMKDRYLDGSDAEDRNSCVKSLRAIQSAASKAINWLERNSR
jgi:hypothetical protein